MWSKINLNGHQCTSLWHVDDIKISHANEQIVSKVLSEFEKEYGKETNTIMGMVLDYIIVATTQVTMFDYIKKHAIGIASHVGWRVKDISTTPPL